MHGGAPVSRYPNLRDKGGCPLRGNTCGTEDCFLYFQVKTVTREFPYLWHKYRKSLSVKGKWQEESQREP